MRSALECGGRHRRLSSGEAMILRKKAGAWLPHSEGRLRRREHRFHGLRISKGRPQDAAESCRSWDFGTYEEKAKHNMTWGMRNVVICLYGSSIMEGRIGVDHPRDRWYNIFQSLLSRAHPDTCFPIVNSAVGGESTREVLSRFDRDILPYRPHFCLFMVGGNNHDCLDPSRILAEGELSVLMDRFVSRLPQSARPVGVVLGPVVDDWHFATNHPAYRTYLALFGGSLDASLNPEREFARSFYRRHAWPFLDLYAIMSDKHIVPEDGIHLNKAGHELFARKMYEIMDPLL